MSVGVFNNTFYWAVRVTDDPKCTLSHVAGGSVNRRGVDPPRQPLWQIQPLQMRKCWWLC